MKKRKLYGSPLVGYLVFFLLVSAIITVAVLLYSALAKKYEVNVISPLMLLAVAVLAAVCTAIDMAQRQITVTRPVERILDATDRIASGDLSVRLEITHPYRRYNEFDYIMENLNKMTAELSTDAVLKNDFVSNVSHELKTPLSVIQNYATALQEPSLDPQTRRTYAQTLVNTAKKLTDLVANILCLNRLENRKLPEKRESVRLDELLAQTVLSYEDKIDAKQIDLQCDLDEVTVVTYPGYAEIVFGNLLSNAIKFTEAGGRVGVALKRRNGKAVVTVSDTGCGISPEVGARIFDKFYQGDTSHAQEGNGLGLALVKRVIDTVGGEIDVQSEVGKGSTFTVAIPEETA